MYIESNAETVVSFPCSDLKPMPPYDSGERCLGEFFYDFHPLYSFADITLL